MDSRSKQKRVAVVIGSGGMKCAAALGLWRVLQRENIELSMAVGASGGSIYAAVIALGYEASLAEKMTFEFWTSDLTEGYTSNLRAALSGESRFTEHSGLINDRQVLENLRNVFGEKTFEDARVPLHIVSTDLYSGE